MGDITAVIVAAGRGVRMGERGRMTPKGMIALDGIPLVRASVMHLASRGIDRVRIVTGHLADIYRSEFSAAPGIELLHNAGFHESGSLRSLQIGLEGLTGQILILESDIMYEARALDPLVAEDATALVLSGETKATDEVYVWQTADGHLLDMNKNIDHRPEDHRGELVGISTVASGDMGAFNATMERLLSEDPRRDYEGCLVAHAAERPFGLHKIDDLAWAEVDDEQMLERAAAKVWPRASATLPPRARAV
ncbi:hypothetical protein ATO6_06150 [Oceanicola sp. 22II-s10i]|uniref:phosphocholine cytidylyltransferase family protein n=1 Tax=Oceanicola sp. 22II-s10i TaxID=1317116 RepID=UPI000B51EBF9|nr:NTP transferase domain-containing protein [Oceanicola sp. 22II-s10i]OWU86395.1 hypothetical protein ATO6_06150 [Oceanicola sp. 22II-s10i]